MNLLTTKNVNAIENGLTNLILLSTTVKTTTATYSIQVTEPEGFTSISKDNAHTSNNTQVQITEHKVMQMGRQT